MFSLQLLPNVCQQLILEFKPFYLLILALDPGYVQPRGDGLRDCPGRPGGAAHHHQDRHAAGASQINGMG